VAPAAPSTYDPAKSPFGGLAHFKPLAAAIPPLRVTYSCATGFEFAYSIRRAKKQALKLPHTVFALRLATRPHNGKLILISRHS